MTVREVVDLRERVAVAVTTSDLSPDGGAAQIVGAMGAATMVRHFDAVLNRVAVKTTAVGTAVVSDKGRLGALLERAKMGGDRKAEHQAAVLFAHQLATRRAWCDRLKLKRGSPLLLKLAGIVVAEWVHDQCPQCGGACVVPLSKPGARNVRTELCRLCDGCGKRRLDHGARATVLGLPMETYQAHWKARIDEAIGWLRDAEADLIERLRKQNLHGTLHGN